MPKNIELVLTVRDNSENGFIPITFERIEVDTILELATQLVLTIAKVGVMISEHEQLKMREKLYGGDDVPF